MARQNFIGMIISQGKMQKTVKVRVETKIFNKRINKELFHRKDYLVHDEAGISREGDLVRIEATRPLSKRKFFAVAEILKNKGQQFAKFEQEAKIDVAHEEAAKSKIFLDARQEQAQKDKFTLLSDVRKIQDAFNTGTSEQELSEIKSKYGITDFSKDTIRQLLNLNVNLLETSVLAQREKIDQIQSQLADMINDEPKANEFLLGNGVENPESLKKNIKKNILKKYLLQQQEL